MSARARTYAVRAALAAAAVCISAGLVAAYLDRNVFDAPRFGDNAVDALRATPVRTSLATRVTDALVARNPRLISAQPVVERAVANALASDLAGGIVSRAAVQTHNALFSGDEGSIVIDLANLTVVVRALLQNLDPSLAAQLDDLDQGISVPLSDRTLTADLISAGERIGFVAVAAPPLAVALFGAALLLTLRRRRTALAVGLVVLGVATTALLAYLIARRAVLGDQDGTRRDVTEAVLDAYLGRFPVWCLALGFAGALIAASAASLIGPVDARALPRRAWAFVAREPRRPALRLLRALGLVAVGTLIVVERHTVPVLAAMLAGGYVVVVGLAALLAMIAGPAPAAEHPRAQRRPRRNVPALVGSAAAVAVATVAVALAAGGDGGETAQAAQDPGCNGHVELCERRLDEVVFPSTHNSMAAARAGFLNANHSLTITEQLDLGIRGLLIDALGGRRNEQGVVRTDLTGETRRSVVEQIGADGLAAAQRLAGSIAFGPLEGGEDSFLCHVLCELGATPMADGLRDVRDWLERHEREVLVIFVQDEIPPATAQQAFEDAGLEPFLSDLEPGTSFPTLGEMIGSGRRVLVLAENDGEPAGWYHRGFVLSQDTPFQFRRPSDLEQERSCALNRGERRSPLLLVNHWVESYPPNPRNADVVNEHRFLVDRARRCERERDRVANLLAVDFAERGDVVEAAERLNGLGGR